MKTVISSGGGGARGLIQCGYYKAIREVGFEIDSIIGASVGSLNAAMYLGAGIGLMEEIWLTIKTSDVCRAAPWRLLSNKPAFFDVSPLEKLIRTNADITLLHENPINFYINATSVLTWTAVTQEVHQIPDEDQLVYWLMASAATPIAFPNVNDMVDAGLVANYSIEHAIAMGADRIICLAPSRPEFSYIKSIVDAFDCVASIPEYAQLNAGISTCYLLDKIRGTKIEIVVIAPTKPTGIGLLDFDFKGKDRKAIMQNGYDVAMSKLKNLKW